ncbi:MAG: aminopeptidase P family protein [Christensenellaceae bacterium]|jgi:Xaa-Pro aminopeptidase
MKNFANKVRELGLAQAYLITSEVNVSYVSGFMGDSSQLLITENEAYLFTDSRYTLEARAETEGVEVVTTGAKERNESIAKALSEERVKTLAIEKENVTIAGFAEYDEAFRMEEYVDISGALTDIRAVKQPFELERILKAAKACEVVLDGLLPIIKPGMTELELRAELLYLIHKQGMDSAFAPIVASGENSALPHARPSGRKLQKGDLLTLDFGCKYEGYCSDITRTFGIGNIDGRKKTIYDIVKAAQQKACDCAKTGAEARLVDACARDFIRKSGYGSNFGHGLGHGVGREVHEKPVLNPHSDAVLAENMVFTIEPGIYVEGLGGVRIEDMLVAGHGNAYSFTKELICI